MIEPLTLSRHHIETFSVCRRRFQLRYLERLPWPAAPLDESAERALELGTQFHQMAQRAFLGLDVEPEVPEDGPLRAWWDSFRAFFPQLPEGRRYPELTLTVPISAGAANYFLTGRFDLVIFSEVNGRAAAQIYDWKTSSPRELGALSRSWQTRFYLALLAEGGNALFGRPIAPEQLSMTYWYAAEPDAPRVLGYDAGLHRATWSELSDVVSAIDACLTSGDWPLTDDLERCRRCTYQAYNGRQDAGAALPIEAEEADLLSEIEAIEPDWL